MECSDACSNDSCSRLPSKQSYEKVVRKVPESWIPEEDADLLIQTFRQARPRVLRRYASAWPAMNKTLGEIVSGSEHSSDPIEVQVGRPGRSAFHGFGGTLDRTSLFRLPDLAVEAMQEGRPLYLVQCPMWSAVAPQSCPAKHLMKMVRLGPFAASRSSSSSSGATLSARLDSVNLWVSIGTTHSNLHYDSKHGLLVMLRGKKVVEVFPPGEAAKVAAYPVSDPLRAHHSAAPHCCLAARLSAEQVPCSCGACPTLSRARGFQATLEAGDALVIPEGWWHHVLTSGSEDSSAGGQEVGLAVNIWWRGYPREPLVAQPYVLRRLLSDMLARQTATHLRPSHRGSKARKNKKKLKTIKSSAIERSDSTAEASGTLQGLAAAAQNSRAPGHALWRKALRRCGSTLPYRLGEASGSPSEDTRARLRALLEGLDDSQAASLLTSLDAATSEEKNGGEAAAALRKLWGCFSQRALVAKWSNHLQTSLKRILILAGALPRCCGSASASSALIPAKQDQPN
eukprot:TRINITY_DN95272_c0_g1_i1.p1 TRINITY_DN95272_c0_g1~~TRINITY_DN95272_c0_g1_i1.p1  ORF type:complete len:513 (+),score=80.57 TRINITY_DN95272_c0_g1_i1:56-1594(+)